MVVRACCGSGTRAETAWGLIKEVMHKGGAAEGPKDAAVL